ncbi:MAG: rhomboid family intramembrane serine protease [Alphaproteobacteria bacterium]|nr:rhomboid family intramembrane serine protease [Alphaproteobacteria bacterium]
MFVPLHDDTTLKVIRFQWVTLAIMVGNCLIFLWDQFFATDIQHNAMLLQFGLIPSDFLDTLRSTGSHGFAAELATLATSLFLHGSWLHIIGNLAFLWVFADNIEDAFGHLGFCFFYLICGAAGGLLHVAVMPGSSLPLIGASSAVAGIMGSYIVLFPKARVWVMVFVPVPLSASWALLGWLAFQLYSILTAPPGSDVAFWSHIGGFATGFALTLLLRRQIALNTRGRI